ncbi:uncharacterized protein LOC129601833 [Paramacrobiotus metropolitanus]|uniref:uncharacterized protein LOC129601833 n=1 Tax=Paramacrobiotus metropolitanus TaxID=2943436 RepID=UPI002445AEFA|nr:uncharacterized protein LOC129601833 [Paramacrobiotus metropolitanus]
METHSSSLNRSYMANYTNNETGESCAEISNTTLAQLPWLYHYMAPILAGGLVLIVFFADFLIRHCSEIQKQLAAFKKKQSWFVIFRGVVVFIGNMVSLVINFFIPYWYHDRKVKTGWYGKQDDEYWKITFMDLIINSLLLILLVLKILQVFFVPSAILLVPNKTSILFVSQSVTCRKRVAGTSSSSLKSWRKTWDSVKAEMSRWLRNWEFVVNAVNVLLLIYEIDYIFGRNRISNWNCWNFTWLSLQFLRLLCIVWAGDELLGVFTGIPIAYAIVVRRATRIVCSFFCFAAWIQLMEIIGDPYSSEGNDVQRNLTYGKVVAFLYGKMVLVDVVSVQLESTFARISVYIVQAVNWFFIAQLIPDMFKKLPTVLRMHSFSKIYRKKDEAFVLILGSVSPTALEHFAKAFHDFNVEGNIMVLLESAVLLRATEEMHIVARKHKRTLTIVSGSVFSYKDIDKNISENCQCAFVFANESAPSPQEEDYHNHLKVLMLKQHRPTLRVIVQVLMVNNKDLFYDIPNWRTELDGTNVTAPDRAICIPEIQFALLAQRNFAPALTNVVHDWFNPSGYQTIRSYFIKLVEPTKPAISKQTSSLTTATKKNEHVVVIIDHSASSSHNAIEMQPLSSTPAENPAINEALVHRSTAVAASDGAMAGGSGLQAPSGNKSGDCSLSNSANNESSETQLLLPPSDTSKADTNAPSRESSNLTSTDTSGSQRTSAASKNDVIYQDIQEIFTELKIGTPFALLQEGQYHLCPRENLILQTGTQVFCVTDNCVKQFIHWPANSNCKRVSITPFCPIERQAINKRTIGVELSKVGKEEICDITGQYQLRSTDSDITYLDPDTNNENLKSICGDHIVICVVSDGTPSPIGLISFIKPLRAAPIAITTIIVLADENFLNLEAPSMKKFPDVLFVKGTPFDDSHLAAVKVALARSCIVIDANEPPSEHLDSSHSAGDAVFSTLSQHFCRHRNAVRATSAVTEFVKKHWETTISLTNELKIAINEINSGRNRSSTSHISYREPIEPSLKHNLLEFRRRDGEYAKKAVKEITKLQVGYRGAMI